MPFLAETSIAIPNQDLCSWMFDEPSYDIDKPIYVDIADPSHYITARHAKVLVRKLCAGFRKAGLEKGDCVVIHAFNSIYYPIVVLGIIAFGGIFAGTNPAYTPFELIHHLKTSRAKCVVAEPEILDSVLAAAKEVKLLNSRVFLFDHDRQPQGAKAAPKTFQSWRNLLVHGEEDWIRFNDEKIQVYNQNACLYILLLHEVDQLTLTQASTEAARLFSSGTTGLPKAAMLSHRNFITQHTVVYEHHPRPWPIRRINALPMFHAAIAPVAHTSALRAGETAFVQRRFALGPYLDAIERHAITDLVIVPPQVIAVLNAPHELLNRRPLRSIRSGVAGAAPMDKITQRRFAALMPLEATFTQVWGMTETCCIATGFEWDEYDETGSVGRGKANMDFKLVDDDGNDITGFDVRGEICVRGPSVVMGYLSAEGDEVNRRDWDADGFYRTGDVGFCSSENRLWYLVDRKKELIKVRAFQVAPAELEGVLLDHPGIADAAVLGVKFESNGSELPRAYVVRKPGSTGDLLTAEDVQQYMASKLASYKRLDGGVVFTQSIPKNASGKILKRVLREIAAREIGAKL
ncbi:MAG: hypothetical protein M1821_001566 [Bathelium mastoideum]|nr:MAG: hypothetical protein M1821_001566 [Bathelium mastoideum]KAI9691452.1 MAG: hypothetical protein M1822_007523 [Bathelium mastoideum]